MLKKTIAITLVLLMAFSVISCREKPEFLFEETDDSYIYINQNYGKDERHYLDVAIPKKATAEKGVILYIHGGGWISGDKEGYLNALKDNISRGYISAAVNYRYADGKKVTCADILDDIDSALYKIKEICSNHGYSVDKVMLSGGSAGGHLSLMYAYSRSETAPITPAAVVSYSGPTDLTDSNFYVTKHVEDIKKMIMKISGEKVTKMNLDDCKDGLLAASPVNYVTSETVPTVLCQGVNDDVVPYSNATILYDLLQKHGVQSELVTFYNSGHGLEGDAEASRRADHLFYSYAEEFLQ